MFGPFTAFGTLYNLVEGINALVGFNLVGGTVHLVRDITYSNNALNLTYGDGTGDTVNLGNTSVNPLMSFSKQILEDTTKDQLLKEAFADFLCYLPDISEDDNNFLNLPSAQVSGAYSRPKGKMLRFFNGTNTSSAKYWTIKDDGVDIFYILPQEAYTMVWSLDKSNIGSWTIIPGIINSKFRPDDYVFEAIPSP